MAGPTASNPDIWLKCDAGVYSDLGTTPATDTQSVEQWNDQSGNGRHFTQTTSGSRPVLHTNSVNGLPVIRFDGSDDFMAFASYNGNNMPQTIVAVFKILSDQGGSIRTIFGLNKGGAFGQSLCTAADVNPPLLQVEVKSTFYQGGALSLNTLHVAVANWAGAAPGSATVTGRIDERLPASGINQSYTSGTLDNDTGSFLGTFNGIGGFSVNMDLCELLVYPSTLSAAELLQLYTYLETRYAITSAINLQRYVFAGFFGDDETLIFSSSSDGENFQRLVASYTPSLGSYRDGQYYYWRGKHILAHTSGGFGVSTSFGVASSNGPDGDGWVFTTIKNVDCSSISGINRCWSPKWFVDPADGSLHVNIGASTSGAGGPFVCYETHPTDPNDLSAAWSTPVLVGGSFPASMFDQFEFWYNGTYYILGVNNATGYIELYSSSSAFTGFSALKTGDWMGIGPNEGVSIVRMPTFWRLYYDSISTGMYSVDSSSLDFNTATWGAPVAMVTTTLALPPGTIVERNGSVFDRQTASTGTTVETFSSSGNWVCPVGVTSALVECWGSGGGGAYAAATLTVVPGNTYPYVIGAAAAGSSTGAANGSNGTSVTFNTSSVIALGGAGGLGTDGGSTGGAGGSGSSSTGTTKFSGGAGGLGGGPAASGGGGGGSGGSLENGRDGAGGLGGGAGGGAVVYGGAGGNGGASDTVGSVGIAPGGGGGGGGPSSSTTEAGAAGTKGRVRITYTTPPSSTSQGSVARPVPVIARQRYFRRIR